MALFPMNIGGGGGGSLKDVYRDIVFNGGLDTIITMAPRSDAKTVLNEGQVAIDTTKRNGYVYADFTMIGAVGSATDWQAVLSLNVTGYLPRTTTSSASPIPLTVDDSSSDVTKKFCLNVWTTTLTPISTSHGITVAAGEHYIVYGSWSY